MEKLKGIIMWGYISMLKVYPFNSPFQIYYLTIINAGIYHIICPLNSQFDTFKMIKTG